MTYGIRDLYMDDLQHKVLKGGEEIYLTPLEYKILRLLMMEGGKVIPSGTIYQTVWEMEPFGYENTVAVHIRHIRDKIEENPSKPQYLKLIRGFGYCVA